MNYGEMLDYGTQMGGRRVESAGLQGSPVWTIAFKFDSAVQAVLFLAGLSKMGVARRNVKLLNDNIVNVLNLVDE